MNRGIDALRLQAPPLATIRDLRSELAIERRRFAEHLEAWRQNNRWHAARIRELEARVTALGGTP